MTFVRRRINLTFQFGQGAYGEDGFDTVTITGLRCSASITKAGGVSNSELDLRVWGLSLDLMNRLTILNQKLDQNRHNIVVVEAGDDQSGMGVVFIGTMIEAWADFDGVPDVALVAKASTCYTDALKPVPPTSFKGSVDVALALAGIGAQMAPPRTLENSGVSILLQNTYLEGTLLAQIRKLQRAGDFYLIIEPDVIAIWPKNGVRRGAVPVISPETGMVGYPSFNSTGIAVTTLFNPSITFGGTVEVETVTRARGSWTPFYIGHDLESEQPAGKWFTHMQCSITGQPLPLPSNG